MSERIRDGGKEARLRAYAHYRLRGMIKNLVEMKLDVPLSEMELYYIEFVRETLEELDRKWGTERWPALYE